MADYWNKKRKELEDEKKKASMDYWEKKEKELKEERKQQSKAKDRKSENQMRASASNVSKYTPSSYLQTLAVLEDLKLGGSEEERKKKEQEEGYKRRQSNTSAKKSEDSDIAPTPALMSSYGVTALKAQEDYLDLKAQKQAADQAEADRRKVMYSAALGDHSVQLDGRQTEKNAYEATKKDDLFGMDFVQKGAFTDGYQLGDVTKTILGTLGDAVTDIIKAPIRMGEGIGDLISYGAAGAADLLGYDEWAEETKRRASESSTDKLFQKQEDFLDRYSVLGRTSESIAEGVGQAATLVATGGLAGAAGLGTVGSTILTTGLTGTAAIGGNIGEAYQSGATDEEAALYGITTGTAEALFELLSGGLGKGVNAIGVGKGLGGIDDIVAEGLTRKINNVLVKNLTQAGVKATGEGLEEVLSGLTSAAMKKATYMNEEELSEILADENLLEQFVVGAMASGIMQGGDVISDTKAGRDMATGLNQTEQTVVDKLFEERLAEAEKDGKKLKGKDKTELYDGIVSDMEKGYLDKGKIEEILGGEDYTAYKDALAEEEGKLAELEELRGIKESELTVGQRERYDELKAEVESWKSGTYDEGDHYISNQKSTELGAKLTSKVADMVKDTKLTETWKQDLMKREAFSADPSAYKNKSARQTMENLVKSGVVNNSNRSHEMAQTLTNLSERKGYVFDFTSNAKLKASGMVKEGTTVNGYISKDGKTITVNLDSPKAWQFIVGHEITHSLEGTAEYKEFKTLLMQYAQGQEGWDNYWNRVENTFRTYGEVGIAVSSNADQMAGEITADLVGEYLFQDEAFVTELATKHRNVFQKIYDEIKHLIKMVTAGSKEAKDLERLHHAFEKAWAKGGSVQSYADTSVDTKPKVITEEDVADAEPVSMELTAEQEEYFKDSKVRDEDGNLKVMYHGTSRGGFTVFDPYGASKNGNLFGAGTYFTDDESVANGYTARGKGENKQVYKTYLNITNPIDMDALANVQEWEKAFPDADYPEVGTNEEFYRAMEEHMDGMEYSTAEAHEEMLSVLESMGYDGITHVGGDRVDPSGKKHRVYIAFRPEQIKAIDNARPTGDADIRYSLSTEQVSEHLRDVIENDPEYDYGHYGIRVDNYNYNEGDTVFNSHELYQDAQYDMDGELIYPEGEGVYAGFYDAGELDGASTIGINTDDPSALQKNISKAISNVGKYATHEEGDYVYLIRGDSSQGGSDIGESIISSPVVLKKYKINEDGTFDEVGTEIDSDVRFSLVEDQKTIDFLENQDYIVTYKSMQYIDGKLYPPMSAEDRGADGVKQLRPSSVLGRWQQADENPGNIKKFAKAGYGKYTLHKGNGKTVEAAYNPYEHSSNLVLNDQFEEAYKRPNLVTVECHIPVSELDGSYKAQYAKDATGMHDWKAGSVASKLKGNPRKVYLSRWLKPVRVLSDAEVAQKYKEILGDQVEVPFNVVSPSLLSELEKAGVKINYKGSNGYQSHERRRAEKAKGDVKFSLSDNAGRKLSDGQAKYFADSKVRDENGKLMVMYHGTPNGDFTVFRDGTYFTADKSYADKYQNPGASSLSVKRTASNPKTYEVYLNIKKPFDLSDPEARDIYINDYIKGGNAVGINPYLSDAEYAKISTIDWTEGEDLREFLQDNGYDYDGLVLDEGGVGGYGDAVQSRGTSYVVFSPEQVKNTDNLNPSGDRDIRFSLSKSVEETPELIAVHNLTGEKLMKSLKMGGMPMPSVAIAKAQDGHTEFGEISLILGKDSIDPQASRYNKVYGGDAWTPTYPRIEYKVSEKATETVQRKVDSLVSSDIRDALSGRHLDLTNISSDLNRNSGNVVETYGRDDAMKYAYLMDRGIPVQLPMEEKRISYGNRENGAIIRVAQAISAEDLKKVINGNREDYDAIEPTVRQAVTEYYKELYSDDPELLDLLAPNEALSFSELDGYVKEALRYHRNGVQQTVDRRQARELIAEKVDQADYEAWLSDLFSGIVEKEGIRNSKETFTPSGNRRGWDALHDDHTLDNVIRAMRGSGEKGIGSFGNGNIFGASAEEYSTINEMKGHSDRLQNLSQDEYDALKDDIRERLYDLAEHFANSSGGIDDARNVFAEAVSKYKTKSGIANYLKREGQGWATYSPEIVDDLLALVADIRNMPTGYFEAKPQRAVGFDEVGVFVIPSTADPKLKQELLNRGYSIAEYDPSVEGDRKRVVNGFEEYKFSLSDVSDMDSRIRGDFATPASSLAYRGESEGEIAPVTGVTEVTGATGGNVPENPEGSEVAPMPEATEGDQSLSKPIEGDQSLSEATEDYPIAPEPAPVAEAPEAKKAVSRKEVHAKFIGDAKSKLAESGLDFDAVLKGAKDLSTFATVDNTPQRVMEKALGYKAGRVLSDLTVNKVAQNETTGIRWLNRYTDRKSGVLAQISRQYRIKPGSKESAAAQMYAEGFYVNEKNEIIKYGESELAKDFPSLDTQNRIRSLATDPRIRKIYDDTLKAINESRTRNAYPEIPRLDNYFLHFRAMGDTFSRLGLPFNPNDIRAKDLPTDLNGVTADLKPGQPYFASAQHRTGKRTSFDLLGGLEMYLNSAKNQIYHIDDIQNLRAFRNYIADMYGQANGLEGLDDLGEAEQQERLAQVYGAHLSTFAKFLNEEANVIAGKTALIDRGLEGIIGRRGMTFLDSLNRQVGANMVGGNISSALTNLIAPIQAFAKTNKLAFIKGMAQFSSNKVASIFGKGDGFADQSPVMVRRSGIERFHRTLWQKMSDPGYLLMRAVDEVSTELIARAKYNEYTAKGMSAEQAHIEADKWTSRLMGDRSLGQQPQLYNSKMLGIVTKFQLEVRNQLDSQFYDTIQETKASNEDIKNGIARNAKTAAQVTSTFVQLAVLQHIFGKAFESVAGYNPAFDIISAIVKAAGFDDEEEDEDTILDNLGQGLMELVEDLPYSSLMTGGRIPMASALPIKELFTGKDQHGNEKSRLETLSEAAPYYLMPGGYGQVKKALGGMDMFSDEHPIAGSYTDSGNLRFPVADTPLNRVQAGLFGQWASGNARDYFDGERSALNPSQTQEFMDSGMSIQEYWKYRDGMKGMTKNAEKLSYINSLPLDEAQKNALKSHLFDEAAYKEENPERYAFFEDEGIGYLGYRQLDEETQQAWSWAYNHQDKYRYLKENGVMPEDYSVYHVPMLEFDDEADSAFEWAFNNPEKAVFGKVFSDGVKEYRKYASELSGIKASKDEGGKTISGSRKAKVLEYINSLDIDYGERLILFKREYNADDSYNSEIIDYLNSREDISFEDTITILRELGFTVTDDGAISWD